MRAGVASLAATNTYAPIVNRRLMAGGLAPYSGAIRQMLPLLKTIRKEIPVRKGSLHLILVLEEIGRPGLKTVNNNRMLSGNTPCSYAVKKKDSDF